MVRCTSAGKRASVVFDVNALITHPLGIKFWSGWQDLMNRTLPHGTDTGDSRLNDPDTALALGRRLSLTSLLLTGWR
jgi:hypothetical protein